MGILVKSKTFKLLLLLLVFLVVTFVVIYCFRSIVNTHSNVKKPYPDVVRKASESDGVWGAVPSSACNALAEGRIYTTGYQPISTGSKEYICSSPKVEFVNTKPIKTMQFTGTGYNDKVTKIVLVMRITGKQDTEDALAAKKSWAIYSALMTKSAFSEILSEEEMQALVNIKPKDQLIKLHDLKLKSKATYHYDGEMGVYTYEILGLPVVNSGMNNS